MDDYHRNAFSSFYEVLHKNLPDGVRRIVLAEVIQLAGYYLTALTQQTGDVQKTNTEPLCNRPHKHLQWEDKAEKDADG